MRLAIIESPLSGDVPRNIRYARACVRDALMHGDAPFASHLLYAQEGVLDDLRADERALGIAAGFAWGQAAEVTLVYTDLGISAGMKLGIRDAATAYRQIEYRRLGGEWSKGIDGLPREAPSPGELVAGVDGPRTRAKGLAGANPSGEEQDRAEPSGQRGSVEGGPPTSTAAATSSQPAGERSAGR